MTKNINLILELPDNCAFLKKLKTDIRRKLNGTATLKSIQLICYRDKMLAEIVFSTKENLVLKAEMLIYEIIENHHPIKEEEKIKIKSTLPNNRFQTIIFERKDGKLTAHVLAGLKGMGQKSHIFREPLKPQRIEKSRAHLKPSEAYGNKGEYYNSITDSKRDFHACVLIEVNE